jgi:hypothetical protein
MADFNSSFGFTRFQHAVAYETRYVFGAEVQRFLQTVVETSSNRMRPLSKDEILWRAQLGNGSEVAGEEDAEFEVPGPHPPGRMKPPAHSPFEGRVNPKGISCLYLANDKETAMAEARPWVGSCISVAQFKVVRDLVLIDCKQEAGDGPWLLYEDDPDPAIREKAAWGQIGDAFSRPIGRGDWTPDYAVSQILAETFRSAGCGGVAYRSGLGKGLNIALFDINAAELVNCRLFRTKSVLYDFAEAAAPYYIAKHYRHLRERFQDDAIGTLKVVDFGTVDRDP